MMYRTRRLTRFRALIAIFSLITCLIYLCQNWNRVDSGDTAAATTTTSVKQNRIHVFKSFKKFAKNRTDLTSNRVYTSFEYIKINNLNENEHFVLLSVSEKNLKYTTKQANLNERLAFIELNAILNLLGRNSVFLLDIDILSNLTYLSSNNLKTCVKNFYKTSTYLTNQNNNKINSPLLLYFGVSVDSFDNLNIVS